MMHCLACNQDVEEGRAMPLAEEAHAVVAPGASFLEFIIGARFHLRYVGGIVAAGPEASRLHAGPVICGPLSEWP